MRLNKQIEQKIDEGVSCWQGINILVCGPNFGDMPLSLSLVYEIVELYGEAIEISIIELLENSKNIYVISSCLLILRELHGKDYNQKLTIGVSVLDSLNIKKGSFSYKSSLKAFSANLLPLLDLDFSKASRV